MDQNWGDSTLIQHIGEEVKHCGAVNPPIFQNSLFVFDDLDTFTDRDRKPDGPGFSYSRLGNPSLTIVEKKIAALERTDKAKVFGSGMAAISAAILACVQQGSHVVAVDMCYGPTQSFLNEYLDRFGVTVTYVSGLSTDEVLAAIKPETTLLYLESPSSLIFRMQDFRRITEECRRRGVTTITDNSYSGAIHQKPATLGVDVIVHSATKYLAGHSDLVAGVVAGSEEFIDRLTMREINWLGGLIMPMGAWLLMRGMRTLKIRMKFAQEQGNALAAFLQSQSWVERVHHVGLEDFSQKDLRDSQMTGSSSLLSFEPKDQDPTKLKQFIEALDVFQLGVSWGGFESLAVPLEISPMGWDGPRRLVRLYAGFEEMEDLTADLTQAAAQAW